MSDKSLHPHFLFKDLFSKKSTEDTQLLDLISQNILFQTLNLKEKKYLSTVLYERVYQPDEPIFQQSDRGLGMYIIAKGRVSIQSQGRNAEQTLVTELGAGSFFGELALIDPENLRSAAAKALERTQLLGFFKPDLVEIIERRPEMGVKILFQLSGVIAKRLLETTEKLSLINRGAGIAKTNDEIY